MKQFEEKGKDSWIASEPALGYTQMESRQSVLMDDDRINGVGPQSVDELMEDLKQAARDMRNPNQWDTLDNFLTTFKQSHAEWFK